MKSIKKSMEELNDQGIEEAAAMSIAYGLMKSKFPNKFPNNKENNFGGTIHEGVVELVADLKIKKDEVHRANIEVNGHSKEYKIILKKDTIEEWNKKQQKIENDEKEKEKEHEKKDTNEFLQMLKILGGIILFLIIVTIFRSFL